MKQQLLAWARLVRLPNVVTLVSDIALGYWVATKTSPGRVEMSLLALVGGASLCFYWAGMILNDVFDVEIDRVERPKRPIPSGVISLGVARIVGWLLLLLGIGLTGLCQPEGISYLPLIIGVALAVCIVLYNAVLKKYLLAGALSMGLCRFLNVLLGGAVTGVVPSWSLYLMATMLGVYVFGITIFAKNEANTTEDNTLKFGLAMMAAVLLPACIIPWRERIMDPMAYVVQGFLVVAFAIYVLLPAWRAMRNPSPERVQGAVKMAIMGIVALDALFALPFSDGQSLFLMVLLIPAWLLGRFLYST